MVNEGSGETSAIFYQPGRFIRIILDDSNVDSLCQKWTTMPNIFPSKPMGEKW
jgi:hypothetical protein